jgi:hypothetical protein
MSSEAMSSDAMKGGARSGLYAGRRRRNAVMMSLAVAATLLGLGWVVAILGGLFARGLHRDDAAARLGRRAA